MEADGSLTVDHPLVDMQWGVRHVLQYGPDAEVLEPAEVREDVARRLAALVGASAGVTSPPLSGTRAGCHLIRAICCELLKLRGA